MDGITQTLAQAVMEMIRESYPVSFITIINGSFGYLLGRLKYSFEIKVMVNEIERLIRQLEREH